MVGSTGATRENHVIGGAKKFLPPDQRRSLAGEVLLRHQKEVFEGLASSQADVPVVLLEHIATVQSGSEVQVGRCIYRSERSRDPHDTRSKI